MAMSKGSVTIDPDTGDASGSGAAKAVFDALDAVIDYGGVTGTALGTAKQQVADICEAVAELVDYIKSNAEVSTTVPDITSGSETASGSGTVS